MQKNRHKGRFYEIKLNLMATLGKLFIDFLFSTTKIETKGFENVKEIVNSRKFINAFWHSRLLLINYIYKGWDGAILISKSEDGEIIARIIRKQGHEAIRGSSSKGGLRALAKIIESLNQRIRPAVITPDGPQGPRFKVQPGAIIMAKKTGYPIVPMSYSAKKIKVFASWDRFILPYPFTKCLVIYGNPVYVPENADENAEEVFRLRLEKELCRITVEADQYFGHDIP
ncbi:MAG: lysophospholipid acyltransferase family protein [Desulfobacteraceae bacterium]|nr:lysophospholipid acyltransferase family protein [Desulfobacteraceae bacterium]